MAKRDNDTDSEDSDDSFTEQLDQIGRLSLPSFTISSYIPDYFSKTKFDLNMPNIPNLPNMPNLPNLPNFDFDIRNLNKVSGEVSNYVRNYLNSNNDFNEENNANEKTLINSIKTIISSRIQMNTILEQLNLGISLKSAIEKLQPLRDIIHENVILPTDDEFDDEDYYSDFSSTPLDDSSVTEPKGISRVINRDQPFINDFIVPEEEINQRSRNKKPRKMKTKSNDFISSDLDIEGLTIEETKELTNLNSLDDFYKQDLMRSKIQRIQRLSVNQSQKNRLVTRLMMGNYYKYINDEDGELPNIKDQLKLPLEEEEDDVEDEEIEHDPGYDGATDGTGADEDSGAERGHGATTNDIHEKDSDIEMDEVILTEFDKNPSYFDEVNQIFGCEHYQRNCKIECSVCQKWFPCRFCHDSIIKDHKLIRNEIKHILCMFCNTPQEPSQYCIECEKELANYYCEKCKLFDNDYKKDIYHCDKCEICRLGLGLDKDYFHCDECNICLSINLKENHKCVNNTTHCNCPICGEYLFTSVLKVVFMKCGHLIHQNCYKELIHHSYKCPLCKKTIVNMDTQFRILDQEILQQPLPLPYKLWRCIISCNDCKGKSNVNYHVLGLKCKYCNSYNTNQQKLIKPEEEFKQEIENDNTSIDRMILMENNLSNNFLIDNDYDGDNNKSVTESEFTESEIKDDDDLEDDNDDYEINNDNDQNLVNIRHLTNKLRTGPNEVSSITSIFQKYINNSLNGHDK